MEELKCKYPQEYLYKLAGISRNRSKIPGVEIEGQTAVYI
jgi:hypothetical protein